MLFKRTQHPGIADGSTTLSFRLWKKAKVKVGGQYEVWTIGHIQVDSVSFVGFCDVTDAEAGQSGFADRDAMLKELQRLSRTELPTNPQLCRVGFHFIGRIEKPRPDLDTALDAEAIAELDSRLDRMDNGKSGVWTADTLALISANPGQRAGDLADKLGRERTKFKADVRRLKKLGLTQSLEVGYQISPRGKTYLRLTQRKAG